MRWEVYGVRRRGRTVTALMIGVMILSILLPGNRVLAAEIDLLLEFSVAGGNGTIKAMGEEELVSGQTIPAGSHIQFTATPAPGFRVIRWELDKTLVSGNNTNTLVLEGVDRSVRLQVMFGAAYAGPESYTVMYDANGGEGTLLDPNSPYTPLPLDQVGVLDNVFEKPGCVFAGWNTQQDGSGTTFHPGDAFVLAKDMTFYAIYTQIPPDTGVRDFTPLAVAMGAIGYGLIAKKRRKKDVRR